MRISESGAATKRKHEDECENHAGPLLSLFSPENAKGSFPSLVRPQQHFQTLGKTAKLDINMLSSIKFGAAVAETARRRCIN